MKSIKAKWSGEYPNLCSGQWSISIDGVDIFGMDFTFSKMGTYGRYKSWEFNDDGDEEWHEDIRGRKLEGWIISKKGSAVLSAIAKHDITLTEEETEDLFNKISACDFRHGSCGGCI